ncbi:tetratricopeptide repeat protein [Streptomyces sp. HB2AG]|uniref:tetratricopeptide repeat protein n=1 Tax=Streptomyces sp. HB2AG TaxID=2983400 RepID=UPI0022AABF73|nr:tetratricopeptide repeat protein [Streptomyces sp. HB2AG]MCZ2528183.1 tetratricopeptide repeat protein [Streptomyces sp. HB2AG]
MRFRKRRPAPETGPQDYRDVPVPSVTVTDTGDAAAEDGGTAVTGHRGPVPRQNGPVSQGPVQVARSGPAGASHGSIAVTGALSVGGDLTVNPAPVPREATSWPVLIGTVPAEPSAFQPRTDLRERIDQAWTGRTAVVLTQVLAGGGGVGKSHLAAACARQALAQRTDLVAWVDASQVDRLLSSYAQAALRVHAPGATGQDAEADARAFLAWLATTERTWLVVLDDITDPTAIGSWWPPAPAGGAGRVLATTRRRDALLSGGGRTVVDVDTYTPAEAVAYLRQRLTDAGAVHLLDEQAGVLVEELGWLPLALSHATAYMINEDTTCTDYLRLFADRQLRLDRLLPAGADGEGYGRQVTAALLLSLDAAQACEPAGLALPALRLAAHLDPAGHPRDLWTTNPVTEYLTTHRTPPTETEPTGTQAGQGGEGAGQAELQERVDAGQARAALRVLHRYGLLTDDARAGNRAVRLHALTARATRETTPDADTPAIVRTAADALYELWPAEDHSGWDLAASLRANTDALAGHAADHLWTPDGHPVLHRAGRSLLNAGLYDAAVTYWERLAAQAERGLGPDHPHTLTARGNLALSYRQAGRTSKAIALLEQVAADRERLLGPHHPHTLGARGNLATSYWQAGRTSEALAIEEQLVADRERGLGPDHPHTLTTRGNLATSYRQAGRTTEAIALLEQAVADSERILGPHHPHTLGARGNLAASYWQAGRTSEALAIEEQVAVGSERILGPDHPDTLTARGNLAGSYRQAGRTTEAIAIEEQVAADSERILGPDHPDTLGARGNLATSYRQAGRTSEAITLLEQAAADSERILGPDHPHSVVVVEALRVWVREGKQRGRRS